MRRSLKRWLIPVSAAMIALASAGTALAADMVNVKVENTRGGYIEVYYEDETKGGARQYLPIGETVQVPEGVELKYLAKALDWHPKDGDKWYRGIILDVEGSGADPVKSIRYELDQRESGVFPAVDDLIIKGDFKALERTRNYDDSDEPEEPDDESWDIGFYAEDDRLDTFTCQLNEGTFSQQLYLINNGNDKVYPWNDEFKVVIEGVEYEDINEDLKEMPTDLFKVDKSGKLTATDALKVGEYKIDGYYEYKKSQYMFQLEVDIGAQLYLECPMVFYKTWENRSRYMLDGWFPASYYIENPDKTTFNDELVKLKNTRRKLVGHELIGVAERSNMTFKDIGTNKISSKISEKDPVAGVYGLYDNYTVPVIEHLTKDDVIPEIKNVGWNKINGEWYYYYTKDASSLAKNQWLSCPDNDNESVWVGADGRITRAGIVTDGNTKYLVDADGHKMRNKTGFKYNGFVYNTDAAGVITEVKLDQAAVPGNAEETKDFVDRVTDNMDTLSPEDKKAAADMVTDALKKHTDTSTLTKEEKKKYSDIYRSAFGEDNIETPDTEDKDGMIVAAGLTSKDFEKTGKVTITLVSEWLTTSSNAVKVEMTFYVNGEKRELSAPVKTETDLPEAFVASYSNASYNFSVSPKPVSYEIKDGKLIITIARTGVYTVQATRKSSGSSSGSHGGSSNRGGRATVKADYKASTGKTGSWILDNKGWWFKYQDGTWPKSQWLEFEWNGVKNWYYFGADGYMVTGWYQDGGKWYYLHPKADGTRGYMYTGWHQIGSNWYYFRVTAGGPKGSLVVNGTTPDGYKVNENGEWVK